MLWVFDPGSGSRSKPHPLLVHACLHSQRSGPGRGVCMLIRCGAAQPWYGVPLPATHVLNRGRLYTMLLRSTLTTIMLPQSSNVTAPEAAGSSRSVVPFRWSSAVASVTACSPCTRDCGNNVTTGLPEHPGHQCAFMSVATLHGMLPPTRRTRPQQPSWTESMDCLGHAGGE